jgi:hypothetical protein
VDIVVLELQTTCQDFECFVVPVTSVSVCLVEDFYVIGLRYASDGDNVNTYARKTRSVYLVKLDTTLIQSSYYCFDCYCVSSVITVKQQDGQFKVIDVPVLASHDNSKPSTLEDRKKVAVKHEYLHKENMSVRSELHGHNSYYCLMYMRSFVHLFSSKRLINS